MVDTGWLNLGSLVLGLVAWILPVVNLMQRNTADDRNRLAFSVASVGACAMSLWIQIFSVSHLVRNEDWSALLDISPVLVLVGAILLAVTLILNAITLVFYYGKTSKA